jgi:quercetin dioxygenase-like cupin family protein
MNDFPEFMKNPVNKVASGSQFTQDIEGYVFDGADSSQMIFWTNEAGGKSIEHTHAYDEYVVVVQGQYTVIVGEIEFPLTAGKEFFIKKGTPHSGTSKPGTRTIHAFGGKRAERIKKEGACAPSPVSFASKTL